MVPDGRRARRRRRLWELNPQCTYCLRHITLNEATLDHIMPRSKGGKGNKENRCLSCQECNSLKGNRVDWEPGCRAKQIRIEAERKKRRRNRKRLRR